METKLKKQTSSKKEFVHESLSYQVIGVVFEVYNTLGYGHAENVYQKAIAVGLKNCGLKFFEQLYVPVEYQGEKVGKNFLDFLIDEKIVLEIKKGNYFAKKHIDQVYKYLVAKKLQLGILAYFAPKTLHIKRVVNLV